MLTQLPFQAVYRSLLHLSWIDKLVDNIKAIFVDLYGDQLKKPNTTIVECHFDEYFDQQIQKLEKTALNTDTRVAESAALVEEAPPSVLENSEDGPPPLPGILSRGVVTKMRRGIRLLIRTRTIQE
jgi:signal recognition particle receptor subunit alpha